MPEEKSINSDLIRGGSSFILSIGIHALIFVLISFLLTFIDTEPVSSGYVEVTTIQSIPSKIKNEKTETETPVKDEKLPAETPDEKPVKKEEVTETVFMDMRSSGFDSTSLSQVYKESTMDLKIKYPVGWVYLDQQVKKKIDGITFWAANSNFDPPPYIHVEVVEKYLFNETKYKHRYDFREFTGYYNDPVEMDNQVTQVVYIRTDDDEDFSIKLIMNGRDHFKAFQPVFFAMIKSFRFGNSIF